MTIKYNSIEDLKEAFWVLRNAGKDLAVNTKDLIITIYN